MIGDPRERYVRFALERDGFAGGVELRAHARRRLAHAVEEHPVDAGVDDHRRELRRVVALRARATVPGVVLHEPASATVVERADHSRQLRHLFVEVELIAFVDADERIGVPEHDGVVATEVRVVFEEAVDGEGVPLVVVELLVPQPEEPDREAALRPREVGALVTRARIPDARTRVIAPAVELSPPLIPVLRVVRRGDDLRVVERREIGVAMRHRARQVLLARRAWIGADVTGRLRQGHRARGAALGA